MEAAGTKSGLYRCEKRWLIFAPVWFFTFLIALVCVLFPFLPDTRPFDRLMAPPTGLFLLCLIVVGIKSAAVTTLFVAADGLGVRYGKLPIKWIYWRDLDRLSERYRGPGTGSLNIRFKSYIPWLSQFSENDARYLLRLQHQIMQSLFNLLRVGRLTPEDKTLIDEINRLNKRSSHYALAKQMLSQRKEQRIDIVFSSLIYSPQDMIAIERSYVEWLETQLPADN